MQILNRSNRFAETICTIISKIKFTLECIRLREDKEEGMGRGLKANTSCDLYPCPE